MKAPRLLIIGLDAATFDLICPWIAEGKLPNLAALMKDGARGRLASILPPITPPAWTSFMTGKNPGKHGIFHFLEARAGTYKQSYLNAASRRAKTIWRMLSDAGYTVGTDVGKGVHGLAPSRPAPPPVCSACSIAATMFG